MFLLANDIIFTTKTYLQESHWHVVQPPSPTPMKALQSTFRCEIGKGSLAARPDVGPTFENFSIITEQLFKHDEIDCDEIYSMGLSKCNVLTCRDRVK